MSNILSDPKVWDDVTEGYTEFTRVALAQLNIQIFENLEISKNFKVLDIACGPGTSCVPLSQLVQKIDAIDFSKNMIKQLQKTIAQENINVFHGDGQKMSFSNESYDLIYSFFGLIFFPDRQKGFGEIRRLLKPGGVAIVSSWTPVEESTAMLALGAAISHAMPAKTEEDLGVATSAADFPLQTRDDYLQELKNTGLKIFDFKKIKMEFEAVSACLYFASAVKGGAPMLHMKNNMPFKQWQEVEHKSVKYLEENYEFPATFSMTANYAFLKQDVETN